MYKKISNKEKNTRIINDSHSAENYITKDISKNVSLAVTKLNGKLEENITKNERVFYFINANVDFKIDEEIIHCDSGDALYLDKDTKYSAEGKYEAVTINVPAFGVKD